MGTVGGNTSYSCRARQCLVIALIANLIVVPAWSASPDTSQHISNNEKNAVLQALIRSDYKGLEAKSQAVASSDTTYTQTARLSGDLEGYTCRNCSFGSAVSMHGTTAAIVGNGKVTIYVREEGSWSQQAVLSASSSVSFYGAASIHENTLLVGARGDVDNGLNSGAAYVFVRDGVTWSEQQKLLAFDGQVNERFGTSVSVHGDTAVVGAPFAHGDINPQAGAVYVFTRTGESWSLQQKLFETNGSQDDAFGEAVSISGDTLAIGEPGNSSTGTVTVYTRLADTWTQQQQLTANDATAGMDFGASVAIVGDDLVVGAPLDGTDAGAAYVFLRDTGVWTQQQKLTVTGLDSGDLLGTSVAIDGDRAVIGALKSDDQDTNFGAAYVFTRSVGTWTETQQFLPDLNANHQPADFGLSVSIFGDLLIVGARTDFELAYGAGAAYAYALNGTWVREDKFLPGLSAAYNYFGFSVDISGDTAIVATPGDDEGGDKFKDRGAAYIFLRSAGEWALQQKLTQVGAEYVSVDGDTALVGQDGTYRSPVQIYTRSAGVWSLQDTLYTMSRNFDVLRTDIEGTTLVVGAPYDQNYSGGDTTGAAYVYVLSDGTWTLQQTLLAADGVSGDLFGSGVSISGNTIAVGAMRHETGVSGWRPGAVYVYTRSGDTWTEQQKIPTPEYAQWANFGAAVSVSGNTLLVGAHGQNWVVGESFATDAGKAFVFQRTDSTWGLQQVLTADDAKKDHQFGFAVSLEGDHALIGAPGFDNGPTYNTPNTGAVYRFTRSDSTWTQQQKLIACDGGPADMFGYALSLGGGSILVGAHRVDNPDTDQGAAYVFQSGVPNAAPVANDDYFHILEDGAISEPSPGVLANDTDSNCHAITAVLDVTTSQGDLGLNLDGSLEYTPIADYCGADSFTYHANDGALDSAPATGDISIICVNDEPGLTIAGDRSVYEDSGSHTYPAYAVATPGGGEDEAGQTFSFTLENSNNALFLSQPAIDSSGTLTFEAQPDQYGTADVMVYVTDSGGTAYGGDPRSSIRYFQIEVIARLDVPTDVNATDGSYPNKIRVTWTDIVGEDSYEFYRCTTTSTESCALVDTLAADVVQHDDTGASSDGTVHYYRLKACSIAKGCSDFSEADGGYRAQPAGFYSIGGTLSGLEGTGLVLWNNEDDEIPIGANGAFEFPTPMPSGGEYDVTVKLLPTGPAQNCAVINGSGTVTSTDVTDVEVVCTTGCNINIIAGEEQMESTSHEACESLLIGSRYSAHNGAIISLSAGMEIEFLPDLLIEEGATLEVQVCGQSLCAESESPMPYGCHSCVNQICDADAFCCTTAFDRTCQGMVESLCSLVCQ